MFGYFNIISRLRKMRMTRKAKSRTLFSPCLFASLSFSVFKFKIFLLICSRLNKHAIHIYLDLILIRNSERKIFVLTRD